MNSSPTSSSHSNNNNNNSGMMGGTVTMTDSGASKWETAHGNFYHVGTLEIDSTTFDALAEIAKDMEMDSDDAGTNSEDDEGL